MGKTGFLLCRRLSSARGAHNVRGTIFVETFRDISRSDGPRSSVGSPSSVGGGEGRRAITVGLKLISSTMGAGLRRRSVNMSMDHVPENDGLLSAMKPEKSGPSEN